MIVKDQIKDFSPDSVIMILPRPAGRTQTQVRVESRAEKTPQKGNDRVIIVNLTTNRRESVGANTVTVRYVPDN